LEQKILVQNPNLKAMDFLVKKSKSDVSLAKQNYIPDFQPELTYNQRQGRENSYSLSFNFNVPLWIHRNSAEVKQAKAQELRDKAELNAQKLNAKTDLHYLYNHAKWHSQALRKFQGEILPLARSAINIGLNDYGLNQTSTSGLLQKIISYEEASSMYWEMWADYMTEYALLEKLTGENL
jgi:outer membrane protein TolC